MKLTIIQKVKPRAKHDLELVNKVKDRLAPFVPYWKLYNKEPIKGGGSEHEFTSCDFKLYSSESKLTERINSLNETYSPQGIVISIAR